MLEHAPAEELDFGQFSEDRMNEVNVRTGSSSSVLIALVAGILIAAVDNFAFGGEVSPIVIVLLLAMAAATLAFFFAKCLLTTLAVWMWVPAAHVFKHAAGLPDTIHPNTYTSIAMLGAFTLVVTLIGTAIGIALRRSITGPQARGAAS
jgi:hypothetical protein